PPDPALGTPLSRRRGGGRPGAAYSPTGPIRLDAARGAGGSAFPVAPGRQDPRIHGRRRADRQRRRKAYARWWTAFFALILFSAAALWATHTRYFALRTELVQGNVITPTSSVLKAAAVPPGSKLLRLSVRPVRRRLLMLPAVQDVTIVRRLPHTLLFTVQERKPWAAIQAGGKTFLVDSEFRTITSAASLPATMPSVVLSSGVADETPVVGTGIRSVDLIAALRCLQIAGERSYGVRIPRIFIDPSRKLWLNVNGFGKALLGPATDLGRKLTTLRTIVRDSPSILEKAEFVDLQNPVSPAYIPRPPASKTGQ
ncbi:MAG: FtsQ-type POTRA domain-containing protein, partial [Chloroflexi bacterium]|nr:FtsQ-type POTRA domain-containing protein [Chloroflexota bacterium]